MGRLNRLILIEQRLTNIENKLNKNAVNEALFGKNADNIVQAKQKLDKQITKLLAKADKNMQKANNILQDEVSDILSEIHEMINNFDQEHGTKLSILDQHIKNDNFVFGDKEWLNKFIDNIKDIKRMLTNKFSK